MKLSIDQLPSPLGDILVVTDGASLCALDYADCRDRMISALTSRFATLQLVDVDDPLGVTSRLRSYFGGDLTALSDVPADAGGTPFQRMVWSQLRSIPTGGTITYGELAARIGRPGASRAVGHANSLNPIPIVLPCHRVIGANATLTGYSGGLFRKEWLLRHEGAIV
jgi:methylated-DNA-[protein]-cysteine S-methyltransferase